MEKVASLLERQISAVGGPQPAGAEAQEGGPSQQLLKSPSIDSMSGLQSPHSASAAEVREPWQPPEIVASESTSPVALPGTGVAQSPFAALALQPLDSTVVEIPARVYHGLLRPGHQRYAEALNNTQDRHAEAAGRWRDQRGLLIFWLVASLVTIIASLRWLQIGVWAGVVGTLGASVSVCSCGGGMELSLSLQVTRIFAVIATIMSFFAAMLLLFVFIMLPCSASSQPHNYCLLLRAGLALSAAWHGFHAAVGGRVVAKASWVKVLIDPVTSTRVIVLRPSRSTPA